MAGLGSTSLIRRTIGRKLRALRERAGITQQQAAIALDKGRATLARIEDGHTAVRFREVDVRAMLTLYGASPEETADLLALTADTRNHRGKPWWHDYTETELPSWFAPYIGLEDAALRIRQYEVELIPGLLQTREYAELVVRVPDGYLSEEEQRRRVNVRIQRQSLLVRPQAPHLEVILNEAALARPVNGGEVMAAQLRHILDVTQRASVSVRILPWAAGIHAGMAACGPFTLLNFPTDSRGEPMEPPLAYAESLTGALYLQKPSEIAAYTMVWEDIERRSLDETASRELFTNALKGLDH